MTFTYEGLINQIKKEKDGLMGIHLPTLSMHYIEFFEQAGIPDQESYYSLQAYIKNASYDEKRELFERLGFKVLFMTLSAIKVIHFAEGRLDHAPQNPCLEEAFLDNKRNVFILEVETGMESLYFVIEYQSDDALANYTVDREALIKEQEQKERVRAIFGRNRNK